MDIKAMLAQLKAERGRLDAAITALENIEGGEAAPKPARATKRAAKSNKAAKSQRKMSAAGRKKISEMMKARWAERRRAKAKAATA